MLFLSLSLSNSVVWIAMLPLLFEEALRCELTSPTIAKGNAMAPTRSPTNGRRQKLIVIFECIVGECESPQFNRC